MFKLWPSLKQYKAWSLPSKLTFISAYIGFFGFIFTLATYFASDEILKILKKPVEPLWLKGRWEGKTNTVNNSFTMQIVEQSEKHFRFEIYSNVGAHTCEISGVTKLDNDYHSVFKVKEEYSDDICHVNFELKNNNPLTYNVTSEVCFAFCGLNATFDTEYIRKEEYFVKMGVIDEINIFSFYEMVDSYYKQFLDSMDTVYETEDIDGFNAKVTFGHAKGLTTITEAAIMQNDKGLMWAAVLSDDVNNSDEIVVKYFTNDIAYSNKLPNTLKNWMKNFQDYKVVYMSKDIPI